ncbi:MAG: FxsA family protein [Alphaproteobacteria bacterium]
MPAFILFALFIGVPVAEIGLFIEVGGWIGLWPTLVTVILTALIGTALLRAQGFSVMTRAQEALNRGEVPVDEGVHGVFLLVAGLLLLTPGFLTDAIGFALFIPPLRLAIGRKIWQAIQNSPNFQMHSNFDGSFDTSWQEVEPDFTDPPATPPAADPNFTPGAPNPESPWSTGPVNVASAALPENDTNDSDTPQTSQKDT